MMDFRYLAPEELSRELGSRIKSLRIRKDLDQSEAASRAGVALRTVRSLERGHGSTTETLLRVLKALDALDGLEALVPEPTLSPMALLKHQRTRLRVRKSGKGER